ncbi:hypothetical protein P0R31_18555 [Bradyrhizobium yuanmingense]|uniref:hypothetical protein n=1 Tax=Bradyrhizobium yuanmingense TaxID=108015 RepID=UPI0023B92FDF|nr:hypothetical protein [Bradyrhizobium yuanmingense]MDF0519243.1 hypothetical protein [Bradyrhizobium yuanmingense]
MRTMHLVWQKKRACPGQTRPQTKSEKTTPCTVAMGLRALRIFCISEESLATSGKTGVLWHHRLLCGFRNTGGCECSFAFSCTRGPHPPLEGKASLGSRLVRGTLWSARKIAVAILQHAVTRIQQIWRGYCSTNFDDLTLHRKHTAHLSQCAAMICIDPVNGNRIP